MSSAITLRMPLAAVDWNGHMDLNGWGWGLMTLGMVAFWGLLILLVVWVIRETGRRPAGPAAHLSGSDPAAILERRLAEGDITVTEYRERRDAIAGSDDP